MKKVGKIIIGILIAILIVWGIIFGIDYIRCSRLKEPIFAILKQSTDFTQKKETYQGLGYRVEVEKYLSKENEEHITKVEMYMFNKFVAGAISEVNKDLGNTDNNEELGRIVMVNGKLYYDTGKESTFELRCGTMDGKISSSVGQNEIPREDNQANFEGDYGYQYGRENTIEVSIDGKWCVFETKGNNNEFSIRVYDKHPQTDTKIHKILGKSEIDNCDYNVYAYDVSVNILINGEELSLRNALLENKITMNEIMSKVKQNCLRNVSYDDGGSTEYYYENYTIIKLNTLDGNRDMYIGAKDLTLHDIEL